MPRSAEPPSRPSHRRFAAAPPPVPDTGETLRRGVAHVWERLLGTPPVWIGLLLALGTWCLLPRGTLFAPHYEIGSVATRDVIAPRELLVPDEESTRDRRARAREDVLPVYDLDPAAVTEREAQLARLFASGREIAASPELVTAAAPALDVLTQASGLQLTAPQVELLARDGFPPATERVLRELFAAVLRPGAVASKNALLENRLRGILVRNLATGQEARELDLFRFVGYPDEVRDTVLAELRTMPGVSRARRELLADLVVANATPNLHPNPGETAHRREVAAAATGTVFHRVRRGQVIVRQGDAVDAADAGLLAEIAPRRAGRVLASAAANVLLLGLVVLAFWWAAAGERRAERAPRRRLVEMVIVLLVALLATRFGFVVSDALARSFDRVPFDDPEAYRLAIPYAAVAGLGALLWGRQLALVMAVALALLAGRMAPSGNELPLALYALGGAVAAVAHLDRHPLRERAGLLRVGLVAGCVNVLVVLVLMASSDVGERGLAALGLALIAGLGGGLLVAATASFALPMCEALFGVTTAIQLVELTNTNLPLLRRLALEAPGTFQHSLMVAGLAQAGCEAIGADPVSAYAGGLYHDIGKVLRPEYFIENQRPGGNRHDKLLPSMSALILVKHVRDGVDLARRQGLPKPLVDAIEQHHGTRLMSYFYHRAVELNDPGSGAIDPESFRYPGPKPQDRVLGVLMLADAVEAASRSLGEATTASLRAVIQTITRDCLDDGQLDHTDLTLGDLHAVSEAFLHVLGHRYHRRIEYPGFDFEARQRAARRAESA